MMRNRFAAALLCVGMWSLVLCCAVSAQQLPGGGGPQLPTAAPGIQVNLKATADPTVNNDQTQGYSAGSLWQNVNTGRVWIAQSVAQGAATWNLLELSDQPGYIASNWYTPAGSYIVTSGAAVTTGTIRLIPGYIKNTLTINNLGIRCTTLAAGGNVQLAIYANNPTTMRPTGTALVSTASISVAATGSLNASASLQLKPGLYWFASNSDNSTAAFTQVASGSGYGGFTLGSATQSNSLQVGSGIAGLSVTQTFGTWPDLTSASFTEGISSAVPFPVVQFQVASVP